MKRKSGWWKVFILMFILILPTNIWGATEFSQNEQVSIRNEVQQILREIDGPVFTNQVTTDELIVKGFQLFKNRKPDAFEFNLYKALAAEGHLKRSQLIALLLMADGENTITWEKCRSLTRGNYIAKLKSVSDIRPDVESLKKTSHEDLLKAYREKILISANRSKSFTNGVLLETVGPQLLSTAQAQAALTPNDTYNTYFGYLHAHTSYSDGTGTPQQAYQYARNNGKLDFFAVTDHGEEIIFWPWDNKWSKIKSAANAAYVPGSFVALWGFEWSNPLLGHINVINTNDYTNCLSQIMLGDLYNWLIAHPEGFGFFNHPGDYDSIGTEFSHLDMLNTQTVPQMVGIENWNGSNSFSQYYYQGSWGGNNYSYWDRGNQKGWCLGSLGNQDNHNADWGTMNQFRTAVLAKNLTREGIIEAYRARRFYATEDKDLLLDFRCQGFPMGAKVTDVTRYFTVTARNRNGIDSFAEIRFYRNGDLIRVQPVSGNSVSAVFTDYNTTGNAYYYVIVKENDDNDGNGRNDEAISSPIWIQ